MHLDIQTWILYHHSQADNYSKQLFTLTFVHHGSTKMGANYRCLKMTLHFNEPDDEINNLIWMSKGLANWQP